MIQPKFDSIDAMIIITFNHTSYTMAIPYRNIVQIYLHCISVRNIEKVSINVFFTYKLNATAREESILFGLSIQNVSTFQCNTTCVAKPIRCTRTRNQLCFSLNRPSSPSSFLEYKPQGQNFNNYPRKK